MGAGKQSSTGHQSQQSKTETLTTFILRFLNAFNCNECVILYHFVGWTLDSNRTDHSPLDGSGLCPLLYCCTTAYWVSLGTPLHPEMDKRDSLVITVRSWRPPSGELTSRRSVLSVAHSVCNLFRTRGLLRCWPTGMQADYYPLIFFLTNVIVQYSDYWLQWPCTLKRQPFAI